jgi:1-deoxy-D-xylulose-5-phosphate synthase
MAKLLDRLTLPQDLRGLTDRELRQVADEVRQELIATLSRVGGHCGGNLGVVELTVALHAVLDSPRDKIVWDVGHQAYPHKMLTGRRSRLSTIRQRGGLAPFCQRAESEHDIFGAGHGGTSISAALGLAVARDLAGTQEQVVAVIGDGAMTAGMAFEALNHAGELKTDLIVILNDNGMGISPNVGGLSRYLTQVRLDPYYRRAKEHFQTLMKFVPLGEAMVDAVEKFKSGVRHLVIPGTLFEDLGWTYLGPVDGHNLREIRETLEQAKSLRGPVLIHVITTKGKGWPEAEADQVRFHAITPASQAARAPGDSPPTYTEVFGETLVALAREDPRIVAITAAMAEGTGLQKFQAEFPHRCFDVGMAEQHAVTFAAGLAVQGRRPVAAIYSTFLQRAFDQILHDVCLQRLPVIFCLDRGGLVGNDGPTHHGAFDLSYLRLIPYLVIMAPKDENEFRHMLKTCVEYEAGPVAVRYPRDRGQGVEWDESLQALPLGRAEVLREGEDVVLWGIGTMVAVCMAAAELLERQGISATVVNARFVKPLDTALLTALAERCDTFVTVEENALPGGFGSAVVEALQDHGCSHVRVLRLGLPDEFVEHGDRSELLEAVGLTAPAVARRVQEVLDLPSARRRSPTSPGRLEQAARPSLVMARP